MTTSNPRPSAEIYQFPVRARLAATRYRNDAGRLADALSPAFATAACCDSWYHEAAMQEADRARLDGQGGLRQ